MTYRIELAPAARRALTHDLPEAVAAACAHFLQDVLAAAPHRVGKQLRNELAGRYSARRGEFRIIYEINEEAVVVRVITIRHRRDVYSTS
ncbi:MAG: type II toxin-antitoxin system RelE/ParE family toxin [Austwickia sp.]|jgi:mRNA interferase RelE/StbE|nr:MAG: type II toxin-antitoxin system RelE/ParE family toxin [Austwickia sp.]